MHFFKVLLVLGCCLYAAQTRPNGRSSGSFFDHCHGSFFTTCDYWSPDYCDELANSGVRYLIFTSQADLSQFDFNCLPKNIHDFEARETGMTEIQCDGLKKLENLATLDLAYNKIQTFNVSCLPESVVIVGMYQEYDGIAGVDLAPLMNRRFGFVFEISLREEDFTCEMYENYTELINRYRMVTLFSDQLLPGDDVFRVWSYLDDSDDAPDAKAAACKASLDEEDENDQE